MDTQVKIDKGIPIPRPVIRGRPKGPLAQALMAMKKGDSVHVEQTAVNAHQNAQRYCGAGNYTIRAEGTGYRIWKIA